MICEFCRMRGHNKPALYTVRVDGIDWELCYDDMWNEVYYMKRGKVVKSGKAWDSMWSIINSTSITGDEGVDNHGGHEKHQEITPYG